MSTYSLTNTAEHGHGSNRPGFLCPIVPTGLEDSAPQSAPTKFDKTGDPAQLPGVTENQKRAAKLDRRFVWHPFTQMAEWIRNDPVTIVRGHGSHLWDARGRRYLDGNSSIWTNLHGHNHPAINQAIRTQMKQIAHSSALGLANVPASLLAERLVRHAELRTGRGCPAQPRPALSKVFFSDDGSTAVEAALKMAYVFARRTQGHKRPRFLSLDGAYHGDTVGAVSVGHVDLFHKTFQGMLFSSGRVMSPYCYRCPFNKARPERSDARSHRECSWQCVETVETTFRKARQRDKPFTAFVVEPRLQGAAGMIGHPEGWLNQVAKITRSHGALLIADEVLAGFARASDPHAVAAASGRAQMLASHQESVQPDLAALAKGMTGGYLPMAATLASQAVFDAFLGPYESFKTFFHGHSYSGNQLGAAASLASLDLLSSANSLASRAALHSALGEASNDLWKHPHVGDVRLTGMALGVELVRDWKTREAFPLKDQVGIRVCREMARLGVLTRPIGNVVVLMPPYSTTPSEAGRMLGVLDQALVKVLQTGRASPSRKSAALSQIYR